MDADSTERIYQALLSKKVGVFFEKKVWQQWFRIWQLCLSLLKKNLWKKIKSDGEKSCTNLVLWTPLKKLFFDYHSTAHIKTILKLLVELPERTQQRTRYHKWNKCH